jgi:outer membrane protein assembly factor BamD
VGFPRAGSSPALGTRIQKISSQKIKKIFIFSSHYALYILPSLLFFISLFFRCAQREPPNDPAELYKIAMQKAEGGIFAADYETAEKYLRRIIELFPTSQYVPDANFGLAYVRMKKGDCAEAAVLFENFYQRYSSHKKSPDALYYSILCYIKFVDTADRDIEYVKKVRELSSIFLQRYPDHEKAEEVSKIREKVLNILAEHHLLVAEFYLRRKLYEPAIRRLEIIVEKHKELLGTSVGKKAQKLYEEIKKDKTSSSQY